MILPERPGKIPTRTGLWFFFAFHLRLKVNPYRVGKGISKQNPVRVQF